MPELLPCPFCGSSEQPTVFGLKPFEWWVECSGYEGLCCKLFLSTTKEEAIKKWNTRTPSDAAVRAAAEGIADYLANNTVKIYGSVDKFEAIIHSHLARTGESVGENKC